MAMTREERQAQLELAYKLREQGCPTYAKLFELFEFHYTDKPVIGYMIPNRATIVINRNIEEKQKLLTIRHEILHEYLDHELRLLDHLSEKYPELDGDKVKLSKLLYSKKVPGKGATVANWVGDYEISNLGYSVQDKEDMRHIKFNGRIVSGLVTEDEHPDWVNLSVEEMWDKMIDEIEKNKNDMQNGGDGEQQDQPDSAENNQGQQSDGGSDGGSNVQQPVKIVHGVLKGHRFFDKNGKDITPR